MDKDKKLGVVKSDAVSVPLPKKVEVKLGPVEATETPTVSVQPVIQGQLSSQVPRVIHEVSAPAVIPNVAPPPPPVLGKAPEPSPVKVFPEAPRPEPPKPKVSVLTYGKKIRLSILIATLTPRAPLLGELLVKLKRQAEKIENPGIEIMVFEDNKEHLVGMKRNLMMDQCAGEFFCYVDDDDDVSDDYLSQLHRAIVENPGIDCVGFRGVMSVAGQGTRPVSYSLANTSNAESGGTYYRSPGHLNPLRKAAIAGCRFPEANFGEDADFSYQLALKKCLKSEAFVDRVLYHYQFNQFTSETHPNRGPGAIMGIDRSIFHVVILSNQADNLRGCIDSILRNEPTLPRDRIVVVDDGAKEDCGKEYPGITWLKGEKPFIFARNANIGIRHCPNDVILMNDDARLETKYGFSSLAFATKANEYIGLTSAVVRGFVGNPNQEPFGLSAGMRKEPRNVAFVCVYIPRDTINKVGLLDERFTGYGCLDYQSSVIMADGSTRPIGRIVSHQYEDAVLSKNLKTGAIEPKLVTGWYKSVSRENQEWISILLEGHAEAVLFTADHKLWTEAGWVVAGNLKVGDLLLSETDQWKKIAKIERWQESYRNRYCISVEDNENFFTSAGLAHNCEDNDYCHRVKLNDLFLMIYDGCVVEHNSTENKSTFRVRADISSLFEQNKKIFQEKWPDLKM